MDGAGVNRAEVHRAGVNRTSPRTIWLKESLDPAIPVPAWCQGQEDTGMETRCSWCWDGPNALGNEMCSCA